MKAVICCLNSKFVHASLAPWCLLAGVKEYNKTGWAAKVMESTINGDSLDFAMKITAENPNVVAFCSYIWNIEKTLEICKIIKEKINATVVLGGPEVSYRAKNVLEKYDFVDFVISGEGEESFSCLLDEIVKGNLDRVSGISYRQEGNIISIPEKEKTGTPVSPFTNEFYENLNGRISYIETSRGCPYRCAFCLSGRCSPLRFFQIEQVKEDIIKLSNSGTQTVKFVDRTFNANSKRANEIFTFIIENYGTAIPNNVCFHFEIAGDILTEETLNILSTAPVGMIQLEIGMQSFNEETLKLINRKTNTQKLIENIKKLLSFNNMHIHIDLIAGLTGEDIKSFENSFNIGYSLKAHMLQMGFLKLLYGAEMRENSEKYPCDFNENPPYEVTKTPWLSDTEIACLKKGEDALERLYNSGRFMLTLDYLTDEIGLNPFELFMDFGNAVDGNKMPLCDYAERVYDYFSSVCDAEKLREAIVCDLLSTSVSARIPEKLKRQNPLHKKAKKYFAEKTGEPVKIALLDTVNEIFVVDYSTSKDLRGRYEGNYYQIDTIE